MPTLYEKIWDSHRVFSDGDVSVLYVDLHLIHEVTSPQAFSGLRAAGRRLRRPDLVLAVADHNVPTADQIKGTAGVTDPESRHQLQLLKQNVSETGIKRYFEMGDPRSGIVHVVSPELGFTQPGMIIVCGDSHTSTHGAFGALAYGIGTSEVEHVFATQTIRQRKSRNMRVLFHGTPSAGVGPKDYILALIAKIGASGGAGFVLEYAGSAIESLSMEGRMTVCNMTIECGARAGLIAPDAKTLSYLQGKSASPTGAEWAHAKASWLKFSSDPDSQFERELSLDVSTLQPMVTWGTSPDDVIDISGSIPDPKMCDESEKRSRLERAIDYMGLSPRALIQGLPIDRVFIGSCTNGRIEDLRTAASVVAGRRVADGVRAMVVPGSGSVKAQAEDEGLDRIFSNAGFLWREPGCSMCLAMNADRLEAGERCASTSNRNFEGRQGRGGRTHLMSPAMAAAAAIEGRIVDVRNILS
jgi:3-isopropylmalate/(R)-2-methylmalate dehydratase large subunit